MSCLRKRKRKRPNCDGNRTEKQAPRCCLVAVYRLVVGTYLVAVLHYPRTDYQDFCAEETEAKATPQVYVRLPELRA